MLKGIKRFFENHAEGGLNFISHPVDLNLKLRFVGRGVDNRCFVLVVEAWDRGKREWVFCRIKIDPRKRCLVIDEQNAWLFGQDEQCSNVVLFQFLSLPFLPVFIGLDWFFSELEKEYEISRHSYAVFSHLYKYLDDFEKVLLYQAMKNSWKGEGV